VAGQNAGAQLKGKAPARVHVRLKGRTKTWILCGKPVFSVGSVVSLSRPATPPGEKSTALWYT
jgi:hypothetical protein